MQLREVKDYYDNGNILRHYFRDDQERWQGKYISYSDTGVILFEINYKDGLFHGKVISYDINGTLTYIEYYWHGEKVTKAEFLRKKYNEVFKCN